MAIFRFEDLIIWKKSIALANQLFDVADLAEQRKHYRLAEQIRAAALSISNNISEGAGSASKKDFAHFLNIARKSLFECVNLLYLLKMRSYISENDFSKHYTQLLQLSKQITSFRNTLIT